MSKDWRADDSYKSYYLAIAELRKLCLWPDGSFDMEKAKSFRFAQTDDERKGAK